MRKIFDEILVNIIMYVAITAATVICVVMFIPAFIYGVCSKRRIKDLLYSYWIKGYGKNLSEYLRKVDEIRES